MKVVMVTSDVREYDKAEPCFGQPQQALFQAAPLFPEIEIHTLSCWQKPMQAPDKLAPNVWFHGILVPKLGWMRTAYQGCIRALRKKIDEIRPDLVHGQGTERECAMGAALSGIPNVVTIHGNMEALARLHRARIGSYLWCAARLENFALKRTGGVFCNSAYTEDLVRARARRTWRVANPIRAEFFSTPSSIARSGKCLLVNVGVISERKRQLELLQLAGELHRKGLEFELHFIGHADPRFPYAKEFLERIKPAEKAGYAHYLGGKSTRELIECFDLAQGMIHFPSEEAFGLVVAESLARDLKLFGSKLGGIVEICSGVNSAELFEAEDWAGLAKAIEKWIEAGYPRAQGAAVCMHERYHPQIIMRRHVEIYEEMLSRP